MATSVGAPASSTASKGGLFARQSSGLVRDISPSSNVILNISFVSIPLAVLVATQAPSSFPGASPFWVTVICAALCIFPVLLYSLFMAVMPRSGGDYVFMSRTLHPWAGFAANFNITAWYLLVIAYFSYLITPFGLSSAFTTIGVAAGSDTLTRWGGDIAGSKGWQFGIGALALVLTAAMMSAGLRRMLKLQQVIFYLSLVGVALSVILMIIHGRSDFVASVSRFGGNYDKIIADAHAGGFTGGGFDLGNTLLAMPLAFASFGYAIVTSYAGGEVRSPKSSGRNAMLLSLALSAIIVAILMALASRTFGNEFLGAATTLSNAGDKAYTLGAPSFFFFFVSMLTTSTVLIVIINAAFVLALFVALPATFLIATRSLFAWSFDRLVPERVSEVDPRTRSPLIANGITLVVSLIFLALIVFGGGGFLQILYTSGLAELLTFMVVAVAGIVFPYRRRAMYESSPIARKVLGLPTITVAALVALAVYVFFFVSLATTDALGANAAGGIRATVIIAAIGILLYPLSVLYNRRRGVNLGLAFRELPPE